jgi:hypothetical protein
MAFRISSTCDHWFSNLTNQAPLKRKFDYYYLCTLLGLAARQKAKLGEDSREFVDEFISAYRPYQRQLIGLLLLTHLHDLGIKLNEKKAVAEQMVKLVAPMRSAQLTDEGFNLLNGYCHGGFRLLEQEFDKPHSMIFFLQKYHETLDKHLRSNPICAADLDDRVDWTAAQDDDLKI